ncbi:MAG: hypothetical protein IKI83_06325 [Prevotella sp.]|nr:hypothetical protein [Prevotella sp.]
MKQLAAIILAICSWGIANAQVVVENDYDGSIISNETQGKVNFNDNEKETLSFIDLNFFSYDHFENYGLGFHFYNFNGFGMGVTLRSKWKLNDSDNFNGDLTLNYSFGVYQNENTKVMLCAEAGPSLGSRKTYNDEGKLEDKFFIDGFIGIKAIATYNRFAISAGYQFWAPKFKFGKDYKQDGFYATLGYSI